MDNWKPVIRRSTCNPIDHPDYILPFGQTVDNGYIADHSQYHCINGGDENPFSIKNEAGSKTWTEWINEPCDLGFHRRCLGSRPDKCLDAMCK